MNITEKGMLTNLTIRQWAAVREDKKVSEEVAKQHGATRKVGRYMKDLIGRDVAELARVREAASALRQFHYTMTLPWSDEGSRLLPSATYFDYAGGIAERKNAFESAVAAFEKAYPDLKAAAEQKLNGLFDEADWPTPEVFRSKFSVRLRVFPLADASDFRVKLGSEEEELVRKQITTSMMASLSGAMADVFTRLKTCVGDLMERLARYEVDPQGKTVRTFRDSAVTNLRELVALVPKLNILNDPHLRELTEQIDQMLCQREAQELRDNYITRQKTVEDAAGLLKKLSDVETALAARAEAA